MRPNRHLLGAIFMSWICGTALAAETPVLTPSQDTVIDYKVVKGDPQETTRRLRLISTDGGKLVRLDRFAFADATVPFQNTLFDSDAKRQFILLYQNQLCLEYVAPTLSVPGLTFDPATHFVAERTDTVASLPCTVWRMEKDGVAGTLCVTKNGIILRSEQPDRILEATAVTKAISPAAFVVPADLRRVVTGTRQNALATIGKGQPDR